MNLIEKLKSEIQKNQKNQTLKAGENQIKMDVLAQWENVIKTKPRKKRAIGYLARRILNELPSNVDKSEIWEISVDEIVQKFDGTRAMIYEIFHVLEAVLVVTKVMSTRIHCPQMSALSGSKTARA